MSDEQRIRDDIARTLLPVLDRLAYSAYKDLPCSEASSAIEAADRLLASPALRRIQAEALREAADSDDLVALGVAAESSDFDRGVDFGADEIFDALRSRADRIERGETA